MFEFRHAYLTVPAVTAADRITNGLQVMVGALKDMPPPASTSQLEAIKSLQTLFNLWRRLAPPALVQHLRDKQTTRTPMPQQARLQQTTPQHAQLSQQPPASSQTYNPFHLLKNDDKDKAPSTKWKPPPAPASTVRTPPSTNFLHQITPTRLTFTDVTTPRGTQNPPIQIPSMTPSPVVQLPRVAKIPSPITISTQLRKSNSHAALVQYSIPTTKSVRNQPTNATHFRNLCKAMSLSQTGSKDFAGLCNALAVLDGDNALAVRNKDTRQLLKHKQLQKDPKIKKHGTDRTRTNWDVYAKELVLARTMAENEW
jgi:hypothetical protein